MTAHTELIEKVTELRNQGKTYQEIGDLVDVSGAMVWKVHRGDCSSPKLCCYFGIEPRHVMVEPCRVCGEVHQFKTCSKKRDKRKRYRVVLEFDSWFEQQSMIDLLYMCGSDRKKQSKELMRIIENFKVKM